MGAEVALEPKFWLRLISFVTFNKLIPQDLSASISKIGKVELTLDLAWENHFSSLSVVCKIGFIIMPPLL